MLNPTTNESFEFTFTQDDFDTLRNMVTEHTGIMLPDNKKTLMYSRLVRRVRQLKLPDFSAYVAIVQQEVKAGKDTELLNMVNAMTTNVTSFFREPHHFEHLYESLPILLAKFKRVRIWSSACSTGEEPWSIAMTVASFLQKNPGADIKVTASDLDNKVIEKAQAGKYELPDEEAKKNEFLRKWLQKEKSEASTAGAMNTYTTHPDLRKLVNFQQLNLLHKWNSMDPTYHVIFCRNVIIYFSKETQRSIFTKFEEKMPSGSILYIGHSESLLNVTTAYQPAGKTTYKKI